MEMESKYIELFDKKCMSSMHLSDDELQLSRTEAYLNFEKSMLQNVDNIRKEHLLDKKQFLKSLEPGQNNKKTSPILLWGSLLIFAALAFFYFMNAQKDLYTEYFESYPMVELTRSSKLDVSRQEGFEYYSNSDFDNAIKSLNGLNDAASIFYSSISNMNLGDYSEALKMLEELETLKTDSFPIYYYKGLCLLRLNRKEDAVKAFSMEKTEFEYYKNLSENILKSI